MDKLGKVMKGMDCCDMDDCDNCPYFRSNEDDDLGTCRATMRRDTRLLLKAQEPVKPTEPDEDNTQYCGVCGSAVGYEVLEPSGIGYIKYNYCPMCGKAVKWDG